VQHNPVGDIQVEHTINKEFELIGIAKDVEEATSINENQSAATINQIKRLQAETSIKHRGLCRLKDYLFPPNALCRCI